jgi:hypothetical protein
MKIPLSCAAAICALGCARSPSPALAETPGARSVSAASPQSFTVDGVNENRIESYGASFYDIMPRNPVLECKDVSAQAGRFFIYDYTASELHCTNLLNDYTRNAQGAGVRPGMVCTILAAEKIWPKAEDWGEGERSAANTIRDTTGDAAWPTDGLRKLYVCTLGTAGGATVYGFFEITNNTSDTFSVDGTISGLPVYSGDVRYRIMTNPPSPRTKPQLLLGTDSYIDPACDGCVRRGINYRLTPLPNSPTWNPLNEVDPYVAVLPPGGQLLFFHNGRWGRTARPVYRGLVMGGVSSGTLCVGLMGPTLPAGKYTIYGVLNTPGASVFDPRYWRSEMTSATFSFP